MSKSVQEYVLSTGAVWVMLCYDVFVSVLWGKAVLGGWLCGCGVVVFVETERQRDRRTHLMRHDSTHTHTHTHIHSTLDSCG